MEKIHSITITLKKSISENQLNELSGALQTLHPNFGYIKKHTEDIVFLNSYDRARSDVLEQIKDIFTFGTGLS